ncbi:hypothetical protein CL617_03720 [archaeon]|nr:hypothetical protein [archaeon]|tara:strand:+ start:14123 stop:15250 length:1128 start_codon:yes stop_codon:yes gene_type:complete
MKIAHICPFYKPSIGGVEQVVEELGKRQISKGNEVHVFTSDWDKNTRIKKKYELIDGIHVHRSYHFFKVANFASFWPSVFLKLYKQKFDIIHTHVFGHLHVFLASLVGKLTNTKLVHTTHCPWTNINRSFLGELLIKLTYSTFSSLALNWNNKIIAITPWELKFIKKYTKTPIEVIPNGVDQLLYKQIKDNNFKKEHNVKDKLVLFFGRFNITKGPDKLVIVAKEILKERKDIDFIFVGPDEGIKDKVISLAKGVKKIQILAPIRDRKKVAEMYQAADVFAMPSFREGLPLTLFEAMASQVPVIASPVNGIPYEMKDDYNGFLVKYNDLKTLKEKIIAVLDNKTLSNKFRKNNKITAEKYNWDIIEDKTNKIYQN